MTQAQRERLMDALRRIQATRVSLSGNWSDRRLREEVRDSDRRLAEAEADLLAVALEDK